MNHLVFQRLDLEGRLQSIRRLLEKADSTAVVVSTCAARLANDPQPENRDKHEVVRLLLDPADSFNPLDVLKFMQTLDLEDALSILLAPLRPPEVSSFASGWPSGLIGEPGWRILAVELFETLVRYQLRRKDRRTLVEVVKIFFTDDVVYNLAVLLDNEKKLMAPAIYGVISAFLQRTDHARSVILGLIQGAISGLNVNLVQRALKGTTFDLDSVASGRATVYIEAPKQAWRPQGLMIRLWLSSLLQLAASQQDRKCPVLFIVDSAAGLGLFSQLRMAQHLTPGTVEVWSFWESLGQIQAGNPADWSAFVGNCQSVEALGTQGPIVATELAAAFGTSAAELTRLAPGTRLTLSGDPRDAALPPPDPAPANRHSAFGGHRVTFAPSWADRWAIVSAELQKRPNQSVVVVESSGECYTRTAADRKDLGRVIRLDPFGILGDPTDQFNPLDLIDPKRTASVSDVFQFAELVIQSGIPSTDPIWQGWTVSLIRAVLQYIFKVPEKTNSLGTLWDTFHSDDVIYNLAVVLDTIGKHLPSECYQDISAFLQCSDQLRSRILTEVQKSLTTFGVASVRRALEQSTFDSDVLTAGGATMYIEAPPQSWRLHGPVFRLWLSSLLQLAASQQDRKCPVLFIVDSAAGLGLFSQLRMAQHLTPGTVEVWSFWESLGQIQAGNPADWSAFVGNCQSVEALGTQGPIVATELAAAFGTSAAELTRLAPGTRLTLSGDPRDAALPPPDPAPANRHSAFGGHRVTFAPSWADRWAIVSAELQKRPNQSVVVVESSGECYTRTAADRKDLGRVIRLDPFGILGDPTDQFNPLDLIGVSTSTAFDDSLHLAELLWPLTPTTVDPFWRIGALSLTHGVMNYLGAVTGKECNLVELRNVICGTEWLDNLEKELESLGKGLPAECYSLLKEFVGKAEAERQTLVSDVFQALRIFGDPCIAAAVRKSSFDLSDFRRERPLTIYIELPTFRLPSHRVLLQLWVSSLLRFCSYERTGRHPQFIVDSPFSAELLPILRTTQSSDVVDVWTFWECPDQIRAAHAADWSAFLANARRIEAIGPQSPIVAGELAKTFGQTVQALRSATEGQRLILY